MMPVRCKLKRKYVTRAVYKKGKYRARTGPNCCNGNCASGKKKNLLAIKKVRK